MTFFLYARRLVRIMLAGVVSVTCLTGSAMAQGAAAPHPGSITVTASANIPSVYFFRGIRQEYDPKFTWWPYGDVGITLHSGDGGVKSARVNVGARNSLHTGSSGSNGGSGRAYYEADFYSTLTLGFSKGVSVGTTFTAYTSPNQSFNTVKEMSFKIAAAQKYAPYGIVAFELSGQADEGLKRGTYLEIGVGPSWPIGGSRVTMTFPVKLGMSLKDYYEGRAGDEKFGFFDGGILVTLPLSKGSGNVGAWNIHGGVDFLALGKTTEAFNKGNARQVIVMGGVGWSY